MPSPEAVCPDCGGTLNHFPQDEDHMEAWECQECNFTTVDVARLKPEGKLSFEADEPTDEKDHLDDDPNFSQGPVRYGHGDY